MEEDKRLIFLEPPRDFFTEILLKTTWDNLQQQAGVSLRTLRAWRSGESSMPYNVAQKWADEYSVELPNHTTSLTSEKRRLAGMIGGRARQAIYGNLGTADGRSLGGKRSIETHRKNHTSPFVPLEIVKPEHSTDLAELVGVLLGDGSLTRYQFIISSNSLEEKEYVRFLTNLIVRVFGVMPSISFGTSANVISTTCSRARVSQYLQAEGLKLGNKVKHQVDVPLWIKEDLEYSKTCLRGLIDTDGCVYFDHHRINGKEYSSVCIAFTNASIPLLDFVEETWRILGFSPTRHGRHVRLRRREEVLSYAKEVGFSNSKHSKKIKV